MDPFKFNGIVKGEEFEYFSGATADAFWPSSWDGAGAMAELPGRWTASARLARRRS
jgi:hypothetical protein